MREYEKLKAESERARGVLSDSEAVRGRDGRPSLTDHLQANGGTMDQGSESSVSDMPVSVSIIFHSGDCPYIFLCMHAKRGQRMFNVKHFICLILFMCSTNIFIMISPSA